MRRTTIKLLCLLVIAFLSLVTPVAAQGTGVIEGQVTMPGNGALPEGLEVELLFLPNGQGPPVIKKLPLGEDGAYRFTEVDPSPQHRYLVRVKIEGEDNLSDVLAFQQGETTLQVDLRLLERTTDASALLLPQVNMVMDVRSDGWLVVALYRYENSGEQIIQNETNPPVQLPLPADALSVQFGEEMRPAGIIELSDGFAYTGPFAPGETPVVVSYLLSYQEGEQEVTLRLGAAAGQVRLFVPQLGQRTETLDMAVLGLEDRIGGRTFEVYEAEATSATQGFTFRFSGLPPAPAPEAPVASESNGNGPRVV
ncbi:MAG: hypothetical protein H0T73_00270, partial [Ardenticatenales bacterium]|nr:hypothetical protein [Ardenticatenales bacterium]